MTRTILLIVIMAVLSLLMVWGFTPLVDANREQGGAAAERGAKEAEAEGDDPDLPARLQITGLDKETYLRLRSEHIARLRGIEPDRPFDPRARAKAIAEMEKQTAQAAEAAKNSVKTEAITPAWLEMGPRPVPNGQTQQSFTPPSFPTAPVTGRATVVVVDPTSKGQKVYLGTAQGGVWRSLDGGNTWAPIFDTAQSLAIGALALAPSNPHTLYVGTGEPNQSGDSFFGVGLYRVDNVDSTTSATPLTLVGPINPTFTFTNTAGARVTTNVFTGRAISKILVHPTDPATIFVSTATGIGGISGTTLSNLVPPLGLRGIYRSTNATADAASVTFQKLTVTTDASLDAPGTGNDSIFDMVFDPSDSTNNTLLATVAGRTKGNTSGVFRSINALSAAPTFTQTLPLPAGIRIQLAINVTVIDFPAVRVTVYAATSEPSSCPAGGGGKVRKSIDGGVTWPATPATTVTGGIIASAEGFCGGQCVYDTPIAVDPNNANVVYLGGNAEGGTVPPNPCPDAMKQAQDGVTFVRDDMNLHADNHYIFFDTGTTPSTVWEANDGGVWKRQNAATGAPPPGTAWSDQNISPLGTIQFQSVAVHPTNRNFVIGGTQDNGTEAQQTTVGNWLSAESGDGGFALIDQSATDTDLNLKAMYHTFFNSSGLLIGFDRTFFGHCLPFTDPANKDSWEFRGFGNGTDPAPSCDGTPFAQSNGIDGNDNVNFYAPMALGPSTAPDTQTPAPHDSLYFGTDRLYRAADRGDTMLVVSQAPLVITATICPTTPCPPNPTHTIGVPISSIGIAPQNDNIRIVGLNDGHVFATITGSSTLTDISPALPANPNGSTLKYVSRAVIDPKDSNTAYITLSYYAPAGQGIFKTTNLNNTGVGTVPWTAAASGIPSIPINAFAIDPTNSNDLFAGTDIGVFNSQDGGTTWRPYGTGLPRVAVFDLAIQPTSGFLRAATHGRGMWEIPVLAPTAAAPGVSGRVTDDGGDPLAGVAMILSGGSKLATTVTDSRGFYSFVDVKAGDFYVVTPLLANYTFSPANRSFSLNAEVTDAAFTGSPDAVVTLNAVDTTEFFVRQQYLDFLGREPDQAGFTYWSDQLRACDNDEGCLTGRRAAVSAAFFTADEFQDTGSFIYLFYRSAFGRRPTFSEFMPDRMKVVGGVNLEADKHAFAGEFVGRAGFKAVYPDSMSTTDFVNKLLDSAGLPANAPERQTYVNAMAGGATRAQVLRALSENAALRQREYNAAFVLMEYFGYLRRDPDEGGYQFWLNVLNNGDPNNYRGMVCAFITSREYQRRFSPVITRSNADCGR